MDFSHCVRNLTLWDISQCPKTNTSETKLTLETLMEVNEDGEPKTLEQEAMRLPFVYEYRLINPNVKTTTI